MSNLYSLLCLLIITSLLCAQGEEFKKLDLKNGQIQLSLSRTLDTLPNTTIPAITSDYYLAMAVSANFGEEYYQQQNLSEDATIQMQIIISRSQSGLNAVDSTCVYDIGSHFQCQAPLCTEIMSSPQTIHYPLFSSINVTTLNLTNPGVISLADGSWQLDTSPLYIHNCQASILTTASSGWIGLGLSGNGASNFKAANPIFSLLFNASAQTKSAQIIFGFNSTCINPSKPAITLHSDSDWKLNVSRVNFGNMTSNFSQGIPLIFDVLTRKTILPQPQAGEIMNQIFNYPGMQCGTSDFSIVVSNCGFHGSMPELPPLEFVLDNGTVFSIPPSAYLFKVASAGPSEASTQIPVFSTLFDSLNPALGTENAIIIGITVLSNYYSVFRQLSPGVNTITLYPLAENIDASSSKATDAMTDKDASNDFPGTSSSSNSEDSSSSAFIVIIIVVIVTIICVGFVGYKKGWWLKSKSFIGEGNINVELRRNEMVEEVPETI